MAEFVMTCSERLSRADQRDFVCDTLSRSLPGWKDYFMTGESLRSEVTLTRSDTEIRLTR